MANEKLFWNALAATVVSLDRYPPERVNSTTFLRAMTALAEYNLAARRGEHPPTHPDFRASAGGAGRRWSHFRAAIESHRERADGLSPGSGPLIVGGWQFPDELDSLVGMSPTEFPEGVEPLVPPHLY